MRIGRNDACPCGSGRKFKACCEGKHSRGMSRGLIALLAAIGVIGAVGVVGAIRSKDQPVAAATPARAAAPTRTTPRPQPPGPVPPGKVWSAEHGHWHDQAPASRGATSSPVQVTPPVQVTSTPKPQPPGPAPAGKVWSPEHGHWHDARTP